MAATATNLGAGYLSSATNVQPGATAGNRTLVLVEAQSSKGGEAYGGSLALPSDNKGNKWVEAASFNNVHAQIKFYVSDGRTKIVPASGDYISLPGDATQPVFWSLWEITEVDPISAGSGSASLTFGAGNTWSGTLSASTNTNRQGLLIGVAVGGDYGATPNAITISDYWQPSGGGSGTANSASSNYSGFSFATNATAATTTATWQSSSSLTQNGTAYSTPLHAYLRVPRDRSNNRRLPRRSPTSVDRASTR